MCVCVRRVEGDKASAVRPRNAPQTSLAESEPLRTAGCCFVPDCIKNDQSCLAVKKPDKGKKKLQDHWTPLVVR